MGQSMDLPIKNQGFLKDYRFVFCGNCALLEYVIAYLIVSLVLGYIVYRYAVDL